ncbi:hypothetical protein SS1G_03439 [Sclerotinia sclerotiorum 1980 UF-70]|uniref:Rhodopsin domain-containing protein n=2 Tax=Sclerotinia sclerotiorum (strain ATCC 18683 / 1980 / Ss-1) TaxID=665079 RepID=A7EDP9_SCLS1|nr:hypothetical protein SS1G_03439 [Sclerotinia sclerotiorum 1980 UF-70]APA10888.1 hypothetical protein sscle_07g056580 [Sclerotinia sclerotiorum 1980 UF-70]EDO00965.1 hypothetical protein SS1G_03439 [Sclerotinia sclerotiorum 1980 UF-70]
MSSTESVFSQAYLDETNTRSLIITCIVFIILDTLFLALRFLSRYYQKAGFGWEDVLMIAGWLTCLGLCIDGLIAPSLGVGTRFEKVIQVMPEKITSWGWNGFYTIPILYCFAVSFPKMSVLVLYLRIFVDRFTKACCWTVLAVISLSAVVNTFTVGFQCGKHPTAAWVSTIPGAHCNNIQAHLTYSGLPNILTDVAMLILPIPVLRKLHVADHVKIGIIFTFLVASAGLVTAIIRFVQFFLNTYASDPTYNAAPLIMWVVIETSIYLISGCLLSCKQVLSRFINNRYILSIYTWFRSTTSRSRTGQSSNQYESNNPGDPPPRRGGNSAKAFAAEGNYYRLEPTVLGEDHI